MDLKGTASQHDFLAATVFPNHNRDVSISISRAIAKIHNSDTKKQQMDSSVTSKAQEVNHRDGFRKIVSTDH